MVARLKLKEIDGRAPPGVNQVTAVTLRRTAAKLVGGDPKCYETCLKCARHFVKPHCCFIKANPVTTGGR